METTKTSDFTCQSKSFISIFFTCQVSAFELQPFSYHDLANDMYLQTAKTVFSHLNLARAICPRITLLIRVLSSPDVDQVKAVTKFLDCLDGPFLMVYVPTTYFIDLCKRTVKVTA